MIVATDNEAEPAEKASGGPGLAALAPLAVVCAAGAFGAVYFLSGNSGSAEAAACVTAADGSHVAAPLAMEEYVYVDIQEILVTIGNEPATRYVKIKTSVISDSRNMAAVKKAEPMLVDAFVGYLRALTLSDFESADFYPKMREQLAVRADVVLGTDVSHGVLVTEFLLR